MDGDTLRTERLILMPLGSSDLDEVAIIYGDADVMRYVLGGPLDKTQTGRALHDVEANWSQYGIGLWAIRDAETGGLIGECGVQRSSIGQPDVVWDVGFTLGRRSWGKGFATEATTAVLADAWERIGAHRLHATVASGHSASRAVLHRLGFEQVREITIDDESHELWVIHRPALDDPTVHAST